jgi:ACS family sodium-dependent inorganic phosphate cotransporter-like MFS transporter 5
MPENDKNFDSKLSENEGKYCYTFIPARFVFIFLGFIGFNLLYAYKVALSVALVAMVTHSTNSSDDSSSECQVTQNNSTNDTETTGEGEFDWTGDQQAMILGAFFYGYAVTQIPGGLMAERFGAKWVLGLSIFATALLALISPLAARISFVAFFIVRVCQGLTEGLVFPSMTAMFARWLPKMERSLGSTIVFTGAQIGSVITYPLTGYLCDGEFMGGWPAIFYLTGILGCVWFVFWVLLIYETPDRHPHISLKELDYIKGGRGEENFSKVCLNDILNFFRHNLF